MSKSIASLTKRQDVRVIREFPEFAASALTRQNPAKP